MVRLSVGVEGFYSFQPTRAVLLSSSPDIWTPLLRALTLSVLVPRRSGSQASQMVREPLRHITRRPRSSLLLAAVGQDASQSSSHHDHCRRIRSLQIARFVAGGFPCPS